MILSCGAMHPTFFKFSLSVNLVSSLNREGCFVFVFPDSAAGFVLFCFVLFVCCCCFLFVCLFVFGGCVLQEFVT